MYICVVLYNVLHHNRTIGLMNPNEPSVLQLNALIDRLGGISVWYSGITINSIQDQVDGCSLLVLASSMKAGSNFFTVGPPIG